MPKFYVLLVGILLSGTFLQAQDFGRMPLTLNKGIEEGTHLIKKRVRFQKKKKLLKPGKIYNLGKTLYINDQGRGLHVINNSNPRQPAFTQFIRIAGNYDIAIKGSTLYADNYEDLVVVNLKTQKVKRIHNVFPKSAAKHKKLEAQSNSLRSQSVRQSVAQSGSMARFSIVDNHLYVLDERKLKIFDIQQAERPVKVHEMDMRFVVETLFRYGSMIFVGGQEGVYIYDVKNPSLPTLLDIFEHAFACDPVVVSRNTAYITLRSNTRCRAAVSNRMDIVDISNPTQTKRIHMMPLKQPKGLAVVKNQLYLCNHNKLELYNIQEDKSLKLVTSYPVAEAYDVLYLPAQDLISVVGKNGVYQFKNYCNQLQLHSKIQTKEPVSMNLEQLQGLSSGSW